MLDFLVFMFLPTAPLYAIAGIAILFAKDLDNMHIALFGFAVTMLMPLMFLSTIWSGACLGTYYVLATFSLTARILYNKRWFRRHKSEIFDLGPTHPPIHVFDRLPPDTRPAGITADLTAINIGIMRASSLLQYFTLPPM